jgi:RNA polymerase sigma-70 factor (sigma-E family)
VTFEKYAETHLRSLLRTATAICLDRVLAEDLVQDVLIKAQPRWTQISQHDSPDAYINRMLVNEYLSWRRRWARQIPGREPDEDLNLASDHAELHADRDALRDRLVGLPRQQRVVLVLRYSLDLSDEQIAEAMGCSPSTVRSYAARALATLRIQAAAGLVNNEGRSS